MSHRLTVTIRHNLWFTRAEACVNRRHGNKLATWLGARVHSNNDVSFYKKEQEPVRQIRESLKANGRKELEF